MREFLRFCYQENNFRSGIEARLWAAYYDWGDSLKPAQYMQLGAKSLTRHAAWIGCYSNVNCTRQPPTEWHIANLPYDWANYHSLSNHQCKWFSLALWMMLATFRHIFGKGYKMNCLVCVLEIYHCLSKVTLKSTTLCNFTIQAKTTNLEPWELLVESVACVSPPPVPVLVS